MRSPCCCCLFRPPDKDLYTPYIFLGVTETFSDLLEECFQIFGFDHEYGICEVCVGRLRDARDFKLQVQRSQAELRARLESAQSVKEEDDLVKSETSQHNYNAIEENTMSEEVNLVKSESTHEVENDLMAEQIVSEEATLVKHEVDVKEELCAAQAALYAGHEVTRELVLGPEGPQPRDVAFTLCSTKRRAQTRKPKIEPKKQKTNQVEPVYAHAQSDDSTILSSTFIKELDDSNPKSIPTTNDFYVPPNSPALTSSSPTLLSGPMLDAGNEISNNPTLMSCRSDSFDSLPDVFISNVPTSLSAITNLINLEKTEEDPEPENTKIDPTPGSTTAPINEENPSEEVKSAVNFVHVEHRLESSNDRSLKQLSPSFDSDSDYSGLSNDKTYVPSSYESLSESDHDLEIEKECLDEPHEVALSRCEDKNITEIENDLISKFSSEDDTEEENVEAEDVLEDKQGKCKRIRERDFCLYCETFILNFARHMVRNHPAEPEVQEALSYDKNSLQRKKKFNDLRKKGNYVSNSQNSFKPVKKCRLSDKADYLPCSKCLVGWSGVSMKKIKAYISQWAYAGKLLH